MTKENTTKKKSYFKKYKFNQFLFTLNLNN